MHFQGILLTLAKKKSSKHTSVILAQWKSWPLWEQQNLLDKWYPRKCTILYKFPTLSEEPVNFHMLSTSLSSPYNLNDNISTTLQSHMSHLFFFSFCEETLLSPCPSPQSSLLLILRTCSWFCVSLFQYHMLWGASHSLLVHRWSTQIKQKPYQANRQGQARCCQLFCGKPGCNALSYEGTWWEQRVQPCHPSCKINVRFLNTSPNSSFSFPLKSHQLNTRL